MPPITPLPWQARLPFHYGWVIVAVAFVTMAIGVTARTAFSLLLPPLIEEFAWDRGLVAGAFSFGFLASALVSPLGGRVMDRHGPRPLILAGVALVSAGLLLAPLIAAPWQLYATLGTLVGLGGNLMGYTVQSLYLPQWFQRRRGMAMGVAFSGVGVGAILLLPWLQSVILAEGWRAACLLMGLIVALVVGPLALLVRGRPQQVGLRPVGDGAEAAGAAPRGRPVVVDAAWAAVDWTPGRALRTARFWWIVLAFFCALFAWYAVQVHQTQYLLEVGFGAEEAAWALGLVSVVAIPGQIGLGALSDRIGREWVWTAGCLGFVISYAALIALAGAPGSRLLLAVMVLGQGTLGYALTSVMGPIVVEIFEGRQFGAIFGMINVALIAGGAAGPWVTGAVHDATGSYAAAFLLAIACCAVSAAGVWIAAPRRVRRVPGGGAG